MVLGSSAGIVIGKDSGTPSHLSCIPVTNFIALVSLRQLPSVILKSASSSSLCTSASSCSCDFSLQAEKTSMILMLQLQGKPKCLASSGWTLNPALLLVGIFDFTLLLWKRGWQTHELFLLHISCLAMQISFSFISPVTFKSPQSRILCLVSGVSFS